MITVQEMVQREVHYCVSTLVWNLSKDYGGDATTDSDLSLLLEQAFELARPIEDWEGAAREAGWKPTEMGRAKFINLDANDTSGSLDWVDLCNEHGIEPYEIEVYEHWIVSDWLADKLIEHGEKVDKDFAGMTVWARTTTGQAIYADHVMEEIHKELIA